MSQEMSKEMIPFHNHPLNVSERMTSNSRCDLCEKTYVTGDEASYYCNSGCFFAVHKQCVEPFINHPIQRNHFFKLYFNGEDDGKLYCHICRDTIGHRCGFAWCTRSNIRMCVKCVNSPPPRTISQPKHHEHAFTLLMRLVTFTCNACGVEDVCVPYVCLECDMMVHKECIDLPRVIMINRHDHRISHTFHLGQRKEGDHHWECRVCRKTIDWVNGAFKCSRCPNYAVHSKCATRKEVWDGVELEDVPEEEEIIEDPFVVVNENGDIIHFSHENHIMLRLDEDSVTDTRCEGCVLPINGDACYKCVECNFFLHKACASLPRKKRHLLHNHKLILDVGNKVRFTCTACKTDSNGFRYVCSEGCDECVYDLRCSSTSEPFHYDLHPEHPLYWTLEGSRECKACGEETPNPLRCVFPDCDYALCMACATLPRKVKSRYDDHFLRLSQGGGNASGELWCDICETKTDPSVRYYTCDDECGVALHIHCVLGDFYYVKEGLLRFDSEWDDDGDDQISVHLNNGATRPVCTDCKSRCKSPFIMRRRYTVFLTKSDIVKCSYCRMY